MCMKYVNAIINCYEVIKTENEQPILFSKPFDEVVAVRNESGHFSIGSFNLVTHINILGTAIESHRENHILYKEHGKLNFIIRLTKCNRDLQKRYYYDLDSFTMDIDELRVSERMHEACFDFVNYDRITNIPQLELDQDGHYVIKLLIKEDFQSDDKYSVQFIKQINIR